jgi:hypothetical protein
MDKLSAGTRNRMPSSQFAGKNKSFPVNDPVHQRMAISGATRSFNAGNISKGTENRIKGKARGLLDGIGKK